MEIHLELGCKTIMLIKHANTFVYIENAITESANSIRLQLSLFGRKHFLKEVLALENWRTVVTLNSYIGR